MEKKLDEVELREDVEENHCKENQTRNTPRHGERLSPDHGDMQGVKPQDRRDQKQREEKQTLEEKEGFSHQQQIRAAGSGGCVVKKSIRSSVKGVSNHSSQDKDTGRHGDEPRGHGPFYYFGGTNGAEIVSSYCESRGWKRIYNKNREDFKIKWCETKSPAVYCNFREGEQLIFQIPNNKVLTTKIGLLSSLREYERVCSKVNHGRGLRRLKMEEFIPTTFRMDVRAERDAFFVQQEGVKNKETPMWICKPTGLNQGRGIFLLRSREDLAAFKLKLLQREESQANRKVHPCKPQGRIVQHYIHSPLLLQGKKFDIRSYLLIACTTPFMVFFRHGYARLTCDLYDPNSSNLTAHLTNQYMQKKNPLYSELKEDTVWSMENFNTYVNDRFSVAKGLPRDWVLGPFTRRMQRIMTQCFFAVKSKLDRRLGVFDLIGCDFMVDEDFKVWLLEMNCNPALHTNCVVLREVIPSTVVESLDLTFEIFNKCRRRQKLLPLASQRDFVLLFNGDFPHCSGQTCKNDKNYEPLQKTPPKIQKTERKRCKSGTEGKSVFAVCPDNCINDVESVEAKGCSKTSNEKAPAPSQKISPDEKASHLQSSISNMPTVKRKSLRPQVKPQLSKCPVHLKDTGVRRPSKTQSHVS